MMLLWMTYAVFVAALTGLAAFAVERAARLARVSTRWVWAAAFALSIGLAMRAPDAEMTPAGLSRDAIPTQLLEAQNDGGWRESMRVRLEPVMAALNVARVVREAGAWQIGRIGDGYVIALWVGLSAMLGVGFVGVHSRFRRARSSWPHAELHGTAVRISPRIGPAAIGLMRPEIVVPQWLLARSDDEQRMAIAHESEHRRARDPQLLAAACVALILFPWNPALWLIVARLRLAIEVDCDRRVLRRGASPKAYGSLLVAVAELASPLRPSALALADDSSHLKTRIIAMDTHRPRFGRTRAALAVLVGALAVLAACEAKEPTAADVDAMTAASAEKAAREMGLFKVIPDTGIAYTVDSVRVSPEVARRLGADQIATVRVGGGSNGAPEVVITTKAAAHNSALHDKVRVDSLEARANVPAPGGDLARIVRDQNVSRNAASPSKTYAPDDSSVAWFLNGIRVDYTSIRSLDRNSIESVEVLKGRAAEKEYGLPAGQKVVTVRTKGGTLK